MRKGLFFWFSVLLAAGIIAGAVFFFGKTPEKILDATKAIPAIEEQYPHLFVTLEEGQIEPGIPERIVKKSHPDAAPVLAVIDDLLPLFSYSKQSAAVVAWHENEAVFYGCFLLTDEMAADMEAGKLPSIWLAQSTGLAMAPSEVEGVLDLSVGGGKVVFKTLMKGEFLMVALSQEGIEKMNRTFSGEEKRIDPAFSLEGSWPAHLRFFDGHLLAQAASLRGMQVPDDPIGAEIAWNSKGESGEIAWHLSGLQEWVPESIRTKLSPHEWGEMINVSDPLIAAAGLSVPPGLNDMASGDIDIPDWITDSGLDRDSLAALAAGPVMFTVGGQSRVFLFSLPGVLMQLPGRGDKGLDWVNGIWGVNWAGFGLTPKPMEGFPAGGFLSIPVSVVAAARDDLAVAGLITSDSIKGDLAIKDIVPIGENKALFWFYADFPGVADALEDIAKLGGIAERFGAGPSTPEDLLAAVEELRSAGKVWIVLNDLESGEGGWQDAVTSQE